MKKYQQLRSKFPVLKGFICTKDTVYLAITYKLKYLGFTGRRDHSTKPSINYRLINYTLCINFCEPGTIELIPILDLGKVLTFIIGCRNSGLKLTKKAKGVEKFHFL